MQSGCGSPSDDSSRFSDGLKMAGVDDASSRRTGNQGWLGQYGQTRIISDFSLLILERQFFIRKNGETRNLSTPPN